MTATNEHIMDVADGLIRSRGYQGFAFREVAQTVGIKSASVHYHFPTKGDLVLAVMTRYAQRFEQALHEIDQSGASAQGKLSQYIAMFRNEMRQRTNLPLCVMLSADIAVLPESVAQALRYFYDMNLDWLSRQLEALQTNKHTTPQSQQACFFLACLHGALLGARSLNDPGYFEQVINMLDQQLQFDDELAPSLT